jgi:hypothetical protein
MQPKQSCQLVGVQLHSGLASELVDQPSPLLHPTAPPPPTTADVHLTLVEQAMLLRSKLHDYLVRVESFLLRVGAAFGTLLEAPPPVDLNVGVGGVVEEGLYGGPPPPLMPCRARYRSPMR